MQVGQTVWIKRHRRGVGSLPSIQQDVIHSIGNKYFYLVGDTKQKWNKASLHIESDFSRADKVYLSEEELDNEIEAERLTSKFRRLFDGWGKLPYTLEQLRAIDKIISE